jgi:hypothetical protein
MDGKVWYQQQLKTEEWKAKRREVYDRDGRKCVDCGGTRFTLNCHHKYYVKGKMPWDYPPDALVTVCKACHEKRHEKQIIIYASQEDAERWSLVAVAEAAMIEIELEGRDRRIDRLKSRDAVWNNEGRFYCFVDKKGRDRFFDEDGNPM